MKDPRVEHALMQIARDIVAEIKGGCKLCGGILTPDWVQNNLQVECKNEKCNAASFGHNLINRKQMQEISKQLNQ